LWPQHADNSSSLLFNKSCASDWRWSQKQFEEAVREFEKATQMEPESNDYRARLRHAKLELKKSLRKDYYKILELSQDAGENDIKKAYKRAALKYHPDKWGNATDEEKEEAEVRFKDIGEAYALLSDPVKRRKYDAGQDLEEIEHGGGFGQQEMDPSQIFQMFMGGRGGMGGMGGMHGF
jgi:DnaJ homolog subfamily C member 7